MPDKIFISYRRDDAKAEARSIYQHLLRVYGRDRIFMDVDSIQKGFDFTKVLGKSLDDTAVMLVVMGRTWLSQQDENGRRRLDDPADYVRLEVASALKKDIAVVPVRVDGARLPRVEELPDDLKALVLRQGTAITHENFDSDVRGLEDDLQRLLPATKPASRMPMAIAAGVALLAVAGGAAAYLLRTPNPPTTAQATPATQITAAAPMASAAPAKSAPSSAADPQLAVRAAAAWTEAQRANTFQAYRDFIRAYPNAARNKDAAEAAVPLLIAQFERKLDEAIANSRRRDGTPSSYSTGKDPRVMAMCIEWQGTSYDTILNHAWGSSSFISNTSMTMDEREKTALAFCNNSGPPARCTCEIVHRNGKPALKFPQDWIARQLR